MLNKYNTALLNKILFEFQNGKKIDSFLKLKKFVKKNPEDDIARYNLGYISQQLKDEPLAISCYEKVINRNKNHWQSRFNLYLILINKQKYLSALDLVNQVLDIKKNFQPAQRDKALILNYLKKPDEALNYARDSIKQNPQDYIAFNTLGLILISLKNYDEAEKILLQAIKINAKYVSSYNNLGHCYNLVNNVSKALKYFLEAEKLDPNSHEPKNNLANLYLESGDYKKALRFYKIALEQRPSDHTILYNIAIANFNLNNDSEAEKYYKKSHSLNPSDEVLQKNFSMLLLKKQKYSEAWELFEGRLKLKEFIIKNSNMDNVRKKLWKGEKLNKDKKILIVKEQGIGDEILYGSMYPDILNQYPKTVIESDPRLITLFDRSFNNNKKNKFFPFTKFSGNISALDKFDYTIYAGSLGRICRKKKSHFSQKSFLIPKNNLLNKIKNQLMQISNNPKIGISWNSKRERIGKDKSINLELLLPILKLKNLTFVNLQYGNTNLEINKIFKKHKIKIHTLNDVDLFNDFESIAALLKNLDLFITVSNSTAHLAGGLGVSTWLIKPKNHATFHYWNQPNNSTPWYPSIKIFSSKIKRVDTIKEIKNGLVKMFNN